MRNQFFRLLFLGLSFGFCTACSTVKDGPIANPQPVTVPVEASKPISTPSVAVPPVVQKPKVTHKLGIIGEVEPIYFLPMKTPFMARIDTGAENSSIDVSDMRVFEREGQKWVGFDLVNKKSGEKTHFEKKIYRQTAIKRQGDHEERIVVLMTVKMGKEKIAAQFSLSDRSKFEYQVLIGRNILKGRAIVDPALSKTLY